ncbi:MAG: HAD-IIIA family hydrolase [Deltaproteobacteria bacterium]|nr:HAD-IIIA family hydrolase [Deltaproteobacteria bacterium]
MKKSSKFKVQSSKLRKKIEKIKILIIDVDGVMTDGSIIYNDDGKETKVFDVKDGHGIKMLMNAGVDVAIITARKSGVVRHRAKNLGIKMVYQKAMDKVSAFNDILAKTSLKPENAAYMGDELVDIPLLKRAGVSITVPDGVKEAKEFSDYITKMPGGKGAVREACELIIKTQGQWENAIKKYLA